MSKTKDFHITVPASLITNPDIDDFTVATYVFLSITKSGNSLNSFSPLHFFSVVNKKENARNKNALLNALDVLDIDGRIKLLKSSNGITYEISNHFCDDKQFAAIKAGELKRIFNIGNLFTLRLFLFIKLKMIKGLYFQSFTSFARLFNKDKKYIKKQCDLLQSIGVIGNIRFTSSYKKKNKTKFVRFHIFSDMSYANWESRAVEYSDKLKECQLKTFDYSDDNLW